MLLTAILAALMLPCVAPAQTQEPAHARETVRAGSVHGSVTDAATRRPLPGADVVVLGLGLEAATGVDGRFAAADVPAGLHRLRVAATGYDAAILHDVVVRSNRITTVAAALDAAGTGLRETVDVTADYFSAAEEEAASTVRFGYEEIRRSPGAAGDVGRMLQVLPSVGLQTDQRNDLLVRGGSPAENLTIVDNIEVPSINHFPTQGASGGVIGLLNTDLVADVRFSAGGFPAEHGGRLSSVTVVTQREGNRSEFDAEISTGMAGAGLLLEGPLAGGRGSWALSARRSFLELIADAIGTGGVVPRYSDVQGMATFDLGPAHRIRLLGLGGFDALREEDDDGAVSAGTRQYVGGGNWRWLWSGDGYAETSIAYTRGDHRVSVADAPAGETRGPLLFDNESREQEVVLRSRWHHRPRTGTALTWGVTARRALIRAAVFDAPEVTRVNTVDERLDVRKSLATNRTGAFASLEQSLGPRLTATLGGRFDHDALDGRGRWSPRLGLAYDLDPVTTLTAAAGVYRQPLPAWLLVQHPDNRRLDNPRAHHYIAGMRRRLTSSTLLGIEAYRKDYRGLPFDPDDPTALVLDQFADFATPAPGRLVGGGAARSHGVETLVRKRLTRRLHGLASYAYAVSRYTDLEGTERNRTFDHRHVASAVLGYRPSDRFEVGVRWRYAGGRPYTPFDPVLSSRAGTGIIQRDRVNAERQPAYHRLDVRFDHRRQFEHVNLVSFVSVFNAYNRRNLFRYYWSTRRNRTGRADQWGFLPVGGFELEF